MGTRLGWYYRELWPSFRSRNPSPPPPSPATALYIHTARHTFVHTARVAAFNDRAVYANFPIMRDAATSAVILQRRIIPLYRRTCVRVSARVFIWKKRRWAGRMGGCTYRRLREKRDFSGARAGCFAGGECGSLIVG